MILASEYLTGQAHGRHIDTLAFDVDERPIIIELERSTNEIVTRQCLSAWVGFQA